MARDDKSLAENMFPDSRKMAKVVPLYEYDDAVYLNQYSHASLSCTSSKSSKNINDEIITICQKNDILYNFSCEYCKTSNLYSLTLESW